MTGKREIAVPNLRRSGKKYGKTPEILRLVGATGNNLKNVTAEIPLGTFTCVTGVSGSGKSTLTIDTLYRAVSKKLMKTLDVPAPYSKLRAAIR